MSAARDFAWGVSSAWVRPVWRRRHGGYTGKMDQHRSFPAKAKTPPYVVALAYPNLSLFEFGIAAELFGLPRPELDRP